MGIDVLGKVTVIVPTYNYGHYLEGCIESLVCQTYRDLEILIIDDGSEDNTREIVELFSDERIIYIYKKNSGLSAARNTGIENISGNYVLFLDSDDLISKEYIESQVEFLEKNSDIDISIGLNKFFYKKKHYTDLDCNGSWRLYYKNFSSHILFFNLAPPHSYFYRRNVVKEVGLFDVTLKACEDYDYILRCHAKKFSFGRNSKALVYYRRHQTSMSANKDRQYFFDSILHERIRDYFFSAEGIGSLEGRVSSYPYLAGVLTTLFRVRNVHMDRAAVLEQIIADSSMNVCDHGGPDSMVGVQYLLILRRLLRENAEALEVGSRLYDACTRLVATRLSPLRMFFVFGKFLHPKNFDLLTLAIVGREIFRMRRIFV